MGCEWFEFFTLAAQGTIHTQLEDRGSPCHTPAFETGVASLSLSLLSSYDEEREIVT